MNSDGCSLGIGRGEDGGFEGQAFEQSPEGGALAVGRASDTRIHGTTRQQVKKAFEDAEQAAIFETIEALESQVIVESRPTR